jgi:ubiquinone/menaquinone biosynthesis C-methylase UbiE
MDDFEKTIRDLLKPIEGTFAYESMVQNHLNTDKFRPWVDLIDGYRSVQGSTVLSSGCGTANDLVAFLDKGAARVYGVEVEPDQVQVAHQRFAKDARRDRVEVVYYDGRTLPYGPHQFDIIFSIHVIEHVGHVKDYLDELFRVLKPGGIVFLDFPNRFYRREQHTGLRWVHLLPHGLREVLLASALNPVVKPRLSAFLAQKLNALLGMRPPYPWQVIGACRSLGRHHPVEVEEALFHNYGPRQIQFGKAWRSPIEIFFNLGTCRMVLRKKA